MADENLQQETVERVWTVQRCGDCPLYSRSQHGDPPACGHKVLDILAIIGIVTLFVIDDAAAVRLVFIVLTSLATMKSGNWLICQFVKSAPNRAMAIYWNAALIIVGFFAGSKLWPVVEKAIFGG